MKDLRINKEDLEQLEDLPFIQGSPKEISEQVEAMPKQARAQALIMLQTLIDKVNADYHLIKKDKLQ